MKAIQKKISSRLVAVRVFVIATLIIYTLVANM